MNETPEEIRDKAFSLARRGYDCAEVESFLASVAADLSSADPEEIRQKSFTVARRGYDKAEVASYLARVAYQLESGGMDDVTGSSLSAVFEADAVAGTDLFASDADSSAGPIEPFPPSPDTTDELDEEPGPDEDEELDADEGPDEEPGVVTALPLVGTSASLDDDDLQRAASEIAALMHDTHESTLRLRAEADQLEARRQAVEEQIASARADAAKYVFEMKTQADRYHAEATAEADAVAARALAESEELLERANADASSIVDEARREADQIMQVAREQALARSSEVLERSRSLVESLASLEADSRRRLSEAQEAIDTALDATTITQLPIDEVATDVGPVGAEETPDTDATAS